MKRLLIVCLSLIVLTGCISTKKTDKINIEGIQEIKYEELTKSLNSNVKFILYIGRPDCGDCQEFYPLLEDYVNKHSNTGIYYLNIKNFRDRAKADNATQEEKDFFDNLYKELKFEWTPTVQVISNGKIIKSYQYLDEDYFNIKDRNEQKEKKQQFIDEYYQFMDSYFSEE
ncbi:MAG: thioredoxin family protein [Coprobacillus sp.]